jgi:riboflavin kinase/FMN adenylyltransferase
LKVVNHIDEIDFKKNSIITIGTFDGIHLAHQNILQKVVSESKVRNARSVVLTFDPHPRDVLNQGSGPIKLLTSIQERQELCEKIGIDLFIVLKFDKDLSKLNFREFYISFILKKIGVCAVVEGYDHHWGNNREGNIEALSLLGKEFGFDVIKIEPVNFENTLINSSLIRKELICGNVENVSRYLNRPYELSGFVSVGEKRGRLLGFPTANLRLETDKKLLPKNGIYFVRIAVEKKYYFGMASIGVRPTFHENGQLTVEVNIFDFEKDIYGANINIQFLRRLRDELKFESSDQLVEQMKNDREISLKLSMNYQANVSNYTMLNN